MQKMSNPFQNTPPRPIWSLLILLLLFMLAGIVLLSLLSSLLLGALFGIGISELPMLVSNPGDFEEGRAALMAYQIISSSALFIAVPLAFIKWGMKSEISAFFQFDGSLLRPSLLVIMILLCFLAVNSVVIEWNQNMVFPGFLSGFEKWAKSKEEQLGELTDCLTTFDGIDEFLTGALAIALIPAIGEELLFRGLIQNIFQKGTKNPHIAIWASAAIFGIFHLQFYGVFPRIFLGALFGYLYFWSGHLILAMLGHFVNNFFTLTMFFLSQKSIIDFDPKNMETSPPLAMMLMFLVAGAVLLYLFRGFFTEKQDERLEKHL